MVRTGRLREGARLRPGQARRPARRTRRHALRTQPGLVIGTPHYMSPEQAEGKDVDERSDLFSLGVILYELTTGTRPFTGDTNLSVLSSILRDTPRPLTEMNPALPAGSAAHRAPLPGQGSSSALSVGDDLRRDLEELEQSLRSGELGVLAVPPRRGRASKSSKPAIDSLAVLPFTNAGGRSGDRVSERRHHRKPHQPPVADPQPARRAAQHRVSVQGPRHRSRRRRDGS